MSVESLIDWWNLAGVTGAVSETSVNWLQSSRPPPTQTQARSSAPPSQAAVWPDDLDAFQNWLATDTSLPELSWPQSSGQLQRILPSGSAAPSLMVITDIPDLEDIEAGTLLTGAVGRLFDAMIAAIGLDRSKIYLSSLAIARPTGGFINEEEAAHLTSRMRHHITLVAPRRVLLLGDKTSRALLPMVDGGNSIGLRPLNHEGGTLDAIAISHPRLLLKQPSAKIACWRQLQLLIEAEPS